MLPDHSWVRSLGERYFVMRIASTSAEEAGMSTGPGAIGASDDADALIVVLVLMGQMVYDQLPSELPRFFTIIATWWCTDVIYHTVDILGIALGSARHEYISADYLSVLVACVIWVG